MPAIEVTAPAVRWLRTLLTDTPLRVASRQVFRFRTACAHRRDQSGAVVLTVASTVLHYAVGLVESGNAAPWPPWPPWPPCAETDSGCHVFQVASRDS